MKRSMLDDEVRLLDRDMRAAGKLQSAGAMMFTRAYWRSPWGQAGPPGGRP